MNVCYRVELSQIERAELTALLSGGKHAARKLKRAQILLAADAGASDAEIARSVGVGGSCRAAIRVEARIAARSDVPDRAIVASSILLPGQGSERGLSHTWSALRARRCRARSSTERLQSQQTGDRAWSRPSAAEGGGASRQP